MILSQAQAEAVYSAIVALNNVGGSIRSIDLNDEISVKLNRPGSMHIWDIFNGSEFWSSQDAFRTAYGLQ
jgi:hypothetical protein